MKYKDKFYNHYASMLGFSALCQTNDIADFKIK
jgi:hypothetical protein